MELAQIPNFIEAMDESWNLDGQFVRGMSGFASTLKAADPSKVQFSEFWESFEDFVSNNDVLRASVFEEAEQRKDQIEREAHLAAEEHRLREQALTAAMQQRKSLEEQFDTLSADVYINPELSQIVSKGAVISNAEVEGGLPLQGEHILLISQLMQLWGPIHDASPPQDAWNPEAMDAWQRWLTEHGPRGANPDVVDSASLKALMDRDAFQAQLTRAQDAAGALVDGEETSLRHTVQVKRVTENEHDEVLVEAVDEDSGELLQLSIPQSQVQEVRRRLEEGGQPVLAKVDPVGQRVTDLLPLK